MSRGKKQGLITKRNSQGSLPRLDSPSLILKSQQRSLSKRITYFARTKTTPANYTIKLQQVEIETLAKACKDMMKNPVQRDPNILKYATLLEEVVADSNTDDLEISIMNTDNENYYPELCKDYQQLKSEHTVLGTYTMGIPGSMIVSLIISPSRKQLSPEEDLWLETLWKLCANIDPF